VLPMISGARAAMTGVALLFGCATGSVRPEPSSPPGIVQAIALVARSRLALADQAIVVVRTDLLDALDELPAPARDSLVLALGPSFRLDVPSAREPCGALADTTCVVLSILSATRHDDTLRIRAGWRGFVRDRCGAGYEATFAIVAGPDGPALVGIADEDHMDCGVRPST